MKIRAIFTMFGVLFAALGAGGKEPSRPPPHPFVSTKPIPIVGASDMIAVSAGAEDTLALKADGSVWAWGGSGYDYVPDNSESVSGPFRPTAARLEGLSGVKAICAGVHDTVVLKNDRTVWSWGYNENGQLGDGSITNRSKPVRAAGLKDVIAISPGWRHTAAVKADGTVWAWGEISLSGDGEFSTRLTPMRLEGLENVVAISAVDTFPRTVVLKADGSVWSYGYDSLGGTAGAVSTTNRSIFVPVDGLIGVTAIAAGREYLVALKTEGTVWTWAYNNYARPPDNFTVKGRATPMRVSGLAGVTAIAAGLNYVVALKADGTVWTWGANDQGQLGDGTFTDRRVPVQVLGLTDVIAISTRWLHAAALKRDGTVWGWGISYSGQLGMKKKQNP
jgi:hypothetical protein